MKQFVFRSKRELNVTVRWLLRGIASNQSHLQDSTFLCSYVFFCRNSCVNAATGHPSLSIETDRIWLNFLCALNHWPFALYVVATHFTRSLLCVQPSLYNCDKLDFCIHSYSQKHQNVHFISIISTIGYYWCSTSLSCTCSYTSCWLCKCFFCFFFCFHSFDPTYSIQTDPHCQIPPFISLPAWTMAECLLSCSRLFLMYIPLCRCVMYVYVWCYNTLGLRVKGWC